MWRRRCSAAAWRHRRRSPGIRHRVKLPIIPIPPGAKPFELSGERLLELEMEAEGGNPGA